MGKDNKKSMYFSEWEVLQEIAKEENIKITGSFFEEIFSKIYCGTDENYNFYANAIYSSGMELRDALYHIAGMQAAQNKYMRPENKVFVQLVRDAIGNSDWISPGVYVGDYSVDRRNYYIDILADIFGTCAKLLSQNIEFCQDPLMASENIKPWELPVSDKRYEALLTNPDNYNPLVIKQFELKKDAFLGSIEDALPGRVLELILIDWDYLWQFSITYEAIQYCIGLADSVSKMTVPCEDTTLVQMGPVKVTVENSINLYRKRLRQFCVYISEIIYFEDEFSKHYINDPVSNRMLSYLDKINNQNK